MKNKIYLSAIIIFLTFCFVIFYNGLNSSNIYTPKINTKQKLPIFEAKDFYSNKSISSEELFKEDIFYIVNIEFIINIFYKNTYKNNAVNKGY